MKKNMDGKILRITQNLPNNIVQEVLREKLVQDVSVSVETINKAMYEAATSPGVSLEAPSKLKPWQSEEIQDLIRKRHVCTTVRERISISKWIQKKSRKLLRKYQNEVTSLSVGFLFFWLIGFTKSS